MTAATGQPEPLSEERLQQICAEFGPAGVYASGVAGDGACVMGNELLAEVERLQAIAKHRDIVIVERDQARAEAVAAQNELAQLRLEWGLSVFYTSTLRAEGPIAETLDEALEVLAEFDAKDRPDVVSRELMVRDVSGWRKVGNSE